MTELAIQLFEESEALGKREEELARLYRAVSAEKNDARCAAFLKDEKAVGDMLCALNALDENGRLGALERWIIEELYLYGRSRDELAAQIGAHLDLLIKDLDHASLRDLRRNIKRQRDK